MKRATQSCDFGSTMEWIQSQAPTKPDTRICSPGEQMSHTTKIFIQDYKGKSEVRCIKGLQRDKTYTQMHTDAREGD